MEDLASTQEGDPGGKILDPVSRGNHVLPHLEDLTSQMQLMDDSMMRKCGVPTCHTY
jgi:hypothetical protein